MSGPIYDERQNDLVQHHGQPQSEPIHGHGGTSYEALDAKAGLVIWSLAVIGGILVIVFAITLVFQKILQDTNPQGHLPSPLAPARVLPPAPQIQVHPWDELPEVKAHDDQILSSYGKDANGHLRIPITQAIAAVVPTLKIEPNAPQGITIPGGQGRDFSGSMSAMPAPYQRPQIQGEIQKNAQ